MLNYIVETNMFYEWLDTNQVSDSAINLYHALMHLNNKTGWKEEFTVSISVLEHKTSLSRSSVIRARDTLQKAGRIKFRSRNGQQSAVYTIIAFQGEPQTVSQTVSQTESIAFQGEPQTVTINKLNNKPKRGVSLNNFNRKPAIPNYEDVERVFINQGGTKEMAEKFFNKHNSVEWYLNGSPIKNFASLVPGCISTWGNINGNGKTSLNKSNKNSYV